MKQLFLKIVHLSILGSLIIGNQSFAVVQNGCVADYIIVGFGTGGGALAYALSQGSDSVLLLEEGPRRVDDPVVLNPDYITSIFAGLGLDPEYSVITAQFDPIRFIVLNTSRGRMWGGSSAHNFLLAARGTPDLFDEWAALSGNNAWLYNSLLPYMLALEDYNPTGTVANPAQRGVDGPLAITQNPPVNAVPLAIATGTATNTPLVTDYNDPTLGDIAVSAKQNFIGLVGGNLQRSFSASNAPDSFFPPSVLTPDGKGVGRPLLVVSDAKVDKVILDGTTAIGVEYIVNGDPDQVVHVFARKKVILAAGAWDTPAILQRSGIGDPALLNSLGIPVVFANPNVGLHGKSHYGPSALFTVPTAGGFLPTLSMTPFVSFIDGSTNVPGLTPYANDGVRRFQIFFENLLTINPQVLSVLSLPPTVVINPFIVNLNPLSDSTVHIVDTNPMTKPQLNFNIYSDTGLNPAPWTVPGSDAANAVTMLKIIKNIADTIGATMLYPPAAHYAAGPLTDQLLFLDGVASTVYEAHLSRTCRMALDASTGVVDGNLNVFGVQNLMIADNSAVPRIADANTSYQAYLIGLIAASILGQSVA